MDTESYTVNQISDIVSGTLIQSSDDAAIHHLAFDSRRVSDPNLTLFFALPGKRHNGHEFLEDVYSKGVRNFIVSNEIEAQITGANVIKVSDTTRALQDLAAHHRRQFDIPTIGITGSNGKTIVKEWLFQLLNQQYNIVRSPRSYNSQIGVPLSVWLMDHDHTLGIFEAGISRPGEMENLERVIRPTIGILTNVGEAHAEGFLNRRHKITEKLKLFINAEILVYCKDHHEITQNISVIKNRLSPNEDEKDSKFKLFSWSTEQEADLKINDINKEKHTTTIHGNFQGHDLSITIPFSDEASIENALHCWATLLYLKVPQEQIESGMSSLGKIAMRLELKHAINNCSIINDAYNSDLGSLGIAMDFLNQQNQHTKRTVILSDILQSGKDEQELYLQVSSLIERTGADRLIGIGAGIEKQKSVFGKIKGLDSSFYRTTDEFLDNFQKVSFRDETILLKGARKFEFERIGALLERKVHETVMEIDLNALVNNLNAYHGLLKPDTKIMAMVKAFSYGSGSYEIANALQYHRVSYLAVAYADEGVELRSHGITLPIMVMNPEGGSFESIIKNQLEPEIYSFNILDDYVKAISLYGNSDVVYPIHVKIDSGMHRLGFGLGEVEELIGRLSRLPAVTVRSVFSHLSASEDAKDDSFSYQQLETFDKAKELFTRSYSHPILYHILNSAGIVRFSDYQMDMVRLGLGLYGIDVTETLKSRLQNVSTLKTTISQLKRVSKGSHVGYNLSFTADQDMLIGIIGIGYADGLDRSLGNGKGQLLIRDQRVPIIGNVCMDMCMVDVTNVPGVSEGDEVIIFGSELPIQELASRAGTIPYEILTGISSRVKRVYFQD